MTERLRQTTTVLATIGRLLLAEAMNVAAVIIAAIVVVREGPGWSAQAVRIWS